MSKSVGNVVDPFLLADKYGAEALRYYLMRDIATGKDSDFSNERVISAHDEALANSLGNLLNRTLDMAGKFCSRTLQVNRSSEIFTKWRSNWDELIPSLGNSYRSHNIDSALTALQIMVATLNRFVEDKRPWDLAKAREANAKEILSNVLYVLAESLRIIAILISPVLPKAAHGIFDQLNWKMELSGKEERFSLKDSEWGRLPDGHVVGKPVPLFPRIEAD
jgi:methionyl-tRNA synthetase